MKKTINLFFLGWLVALLLGIVAVMSSEWKRETRQQSQTQTSKTPDNLTLMTSSTSHGFLTRSGETPDAPPTLKQLICKLDSVACKMQLTYKIDYLGSYGIGYRWIGFAWPKSMSWEDAIKTVPTYQANGWDTNGSFYSTKEQAVAGMIELISSGVPNDIPQKEEVEAFHQPEAPIYGPKNCDPHRQCK